MFRRGTASVLDELQWSKAKINLHMGWSPGSEMLNYYRRLVKVKQFDKLFFKDLL
jgi:hypothetical protein